MRYAYTVEWALLWPVKSMQNTEKLITLSGINGNRIEIKILTPKYYSFCGKYINILLNNG